MSVFDDFLASGETERIVYDLPSSEYHAEHRFISKHGLDVFADSGEKFRFSLDNPLQPTSAMRFGEAFHTLVLEPKRFDEQYITLPAEIKVRRGEKWENFLQKHHGKEILTSEEWEKLWGMKASLSSHPLASELLFGGEGKNEATVLFRHRQVDNFPCKARIDRFIESSHTIIDLKTTASASPENFTSSVFNFRYDVQASFYCDALEQALPSGQNQFWNFCIVAIEKEPPFACAVYYLNKWLGLGEATYLRDLANFVRADFAGEWQGYSTPLDELPLPEWCLRKRGFKE